MEGDRKEAEWDVETELGRQHQSETHRGGTPQGGSEESSLASSHCQNRNPDHQRACETGHQAGQYGELCRHEIQKRDSEDMPGRGGSQRSNGPEDGRQAEESEVLIQDGLHSAYQSSPNNVGAES